MSTSKRTNLYLEASALWEMFYGDPGDSLVEHCIGHQKIQCTSSIWSHLEIHRAVQKRINQNELTRDDGVNLLKFIKFCLDGLVARRKIIEFEVSKELIERAKQFIPSYNLFASDALHLATAVSNGCSGMLVDDYHFTRLDKKLGDELDIVILHTSMSVEQLQEVWSGLDTP